jgi:hypothetical protein
MNYKIKAKITPQSKYHPIRYAQARANFLESAIQALSDGCSPEDKIIFNFSSKNKEDSFKCFEEGRIKDIKSSSSNELFPQYLKRLHKCITDFYYLAGTKKHDDYVNLLKEYNNDDYLTFLQYASFIFNGNNIFDFDNQLTKIFEATDVDNVCLKDIRLPFFTIYLHFGKQDDKKVDGDISSVLKLIIKDKNTPKQKKDIFFLLDGAYVSQCPKSGSIKITLTSIKNEVNKNIKNCVDCYEDTMNFNLTLSCENISVGEAAEIEKQRLLNKSDETIQAIEELSLSKKERLKTENRQLAIKQIDLFIDYLKLIINCILYLQSYPEEIQEDFVQEIPQPEKGFGRVVTPTREPSQLEFRYIKFCRRRSQFFEPLETETVDDNILVGASVENNRSVIPHKRRSHLRKQRYGRGLEHWKFIWIKETTIHRSDYQPNQNSYRIYEVESKDLTD